MSRRLRSRRLWALLVACAVTAGVFVPAAIAQPPFTLTIENAASSNVSCAGSPTMTCVATADGAVLNTTDLENDLDGVTDSTVTKVVVGDNSTTPTVVIDAPVTGTNELEFDGAVQLANTPLTLGASALKFDGTLDGATDLTITGNAEFDAAVGGVAALNSLSVSGNTTQGASVDTTGAQTYTGAVTLIADSTDTGSLVTFSSTLDGAANLGITGSAAFDGAVGGATPLTSLSVSGSTNLNANASTTAAQSYTGAVMLGSDSTETGSKVTFGSTVDGAANLTITGNAEFDAAVGAGAALTSLSVSGTTTLGASIKTGATQSYTGAVTLTGNSTVNGSTITFTATVDGPHVLTVTGNAAFDAAVGGTTPLASLSISGTTSLAGNVTTTTTQTYTGAVTLTAAVTVSSASTIQFVHAVSGAGSLTMAGAGVLELSSAANTYNGGTHANAGTVEFVSSGLGSGGVTLNGGTLEWASGNTQDVSSPPFSLSLGAAGGTLNTNNNNVSFAHAISGSGDTLVKSGAGTLTLAATSGAQANQVTISGGTLSVVGATISAPISVQAGADLSCTDNGTLSGALTNHGGTLTGAPAAPNLTGVAINGSTASVSFTDTANCLPVSYVAQTTAGGFTSNPGSSSPLSIGDLGSDTTYTFTVMATNPIGSTASGNSINATTPNLPSISFSSPTDGAVYAFNQRVDASYTCSDGNGPGILRCSGNVASGAALDTSVPGQHSVTVTATSVDGYTNTQTVHYTVGQPLSPVITIVNPRDGSKYALNQVVKASYSCLDSALGPGIASCTGSVASGSPLATGTLGTHTFTIHATSKDGATTTMSVSYTVVAPSNLFTLAVGARRHGVIAVTVTGLSSPGALKLTIHRPSSPTFTLVRTIKSGSRFTFTLNATVGLKRSLAAAGKRKLHATVSVTYTPRGGRARSLTYRVGLLR